jgi:hypothetical protein
MAIKTQLTYGWPPLKAGELGAWELHLQAKRAFDYQKKLLALLKDYGSRSRDLYAVDQLFRRNTQSFTDIKNFFATLLESKGTFSCRMDMFAFAFLKGAKNFDLLMTSVTHCKICLKKCREQMTALEKLERRGVPLPSKIEKVKYLNLRKMAVRQSARDELRVLSSLIISGPSTQQELISELGLSRNLTQRIVNAFYEIGVCEKWPPERDLIGQGRSGVYAVSKDAIPMTLYCLRERLGLDFLSVLGRG